MAHVNRDELLASRAVRGGVWCSAALLFWAAEAMAGPGPMSDVVSSTVAGSGDPAETITSTLSDLFFTDTSTTESVFDVGLSAEELALIAALGTSTVTEAPPPEVRPAPPVLSETLAPTMAEAAFERPTLVGSFRFNPAASRLVEDLRLDRVSGALWDAADPRLLQQSAGHAQQFDPAGLRGSVVYRRSMSAGDLQVGLQGRSYDRSAGGYAKARMESGGAVVAAGVSAEALGTVSSTVVDTRPRVQANLHLAWHDGPHELSATGHVLYLGDVPNAGFGASGTQPAPGDPPTDDQLVSLIQLRYGLATETTTVSVVFGLDKRNLSALSTVDRLQAVVGGQLRLLEGLSLGTRLRGIYASGVVRSEAMKRLEFDAIGTARLRSGAFTASAELGAAGRHTEWMSIDDGNVVPIGRASVGLTFESFSLSLTGGRGASQADVGGSFFPRRLPTATTWWSEIGLGWRSRRLSFNIVPFVSFTEQAAVQLREGGLIFDDLRVFGFEADGTWWIGRNLALFVAATFAEGSVNGASAEAQPVFQLAGSVRWSRGIARVEAHARAISSSVEITTEPDDAFFPRVAEAGLYLGATGSLELGAGFRLELAVGNGLDTRARLARPAVAPRGFDARLGLSWTM